MPKPNKRQIHIAKLAQNKRRSSDPTHVDNVPNTSDDIEMNLNEDLMLRDASVGSSKITNFFNIQTSNRDQSEGDDWKNRMDSVEEALRNPDLDNDAKSRLTAIGMYFRNLDDGKKKVEASEIVAVSLGWTKNYKNFSVSQIDYARLP
ncbi:13570_t:CDS:2 [Entrophospora sp. SA101]|nr:13570_t:CDS:2 [Entrophospora sp. SA101]